MLFMITTQEEIIKLYQEGKSMKFLSENSTFNYRQIKKIVVEANLPIRGGRKKKTLTEEQLLELKRRYCEESEDLQTIAKDFNWDKETLRNLIEELKLKKKTTNRINKHIRSDYFETIDHPNKAYILGLLFTDGSVDKKLNKQGRIRLQLQAKDKAILEKIKTELQIDSDLILDTRGNQSYSLEFVDEKMFQDLSKYNIIPNKTYEVHHLPTNIPKEYINDYIRGLVDGDGGIYIDDTISKDVTLSFTSYHKTITEDLQKMIDNLIAKSETNSIYFTSAWHCQWRGYNQVLNILDKIYKNAELYIDRKYKLYQKLLSRN